FSCLFLASVRSVIRVALPPLLPRSTLFPYTTLFRSSRRPPSPSWPPRASARGSPPRRARRSGSPCPARSAPRAPSPWTVRGGSRSEEHTFELQSRENLVCRLLLEKKKIETC